MVRPSKSAEDGMDTTTAVTSTPAAASNDRTNDQEAHTPTELNHKVPFSEGEEQEEEPPVSPQLGIDETAMVLDSGSRKSFLDGAQKRNSVILVDKREDETDSAEQNAVDKAQVSISVDHIQLKKRIPVDNHSRALLPV